MEDAALSSAIPTEAVARTRIQAVLETTREPEAFMGIWEQDPLPDAGSQGKNGAKIGPLAGSFRTRKTSPADRLVPRLWCIGPDETLPTARTAPPVRRRGLGAKPLDRSRGRTRVLRATHPPGARGILPRVPQRLGNEGAGRLEGGLPSGPPRRRRLRPGPGSRETGRQPADPRRGPRRTRTGHAFKTGTIARTGAAGSAALGGGRSRLARRPNPGNHGSPDQGSVQSRGASKGPGMALGTATPPGHPHDPSHAVGQGSRRSFHPEPARGAVAPPGGTRRGRGLVPPRQCRRHRAAPEP